MKQLSHRIEQTLDRAAGSWKWQRLIWITAEVGIALCTALLLLGLAVWSHWISSSLFFGVVVAVCVIAACLGWFVKCLMAMEREPNRAWLAGSVEHVQPPLMDRLNTLVELENRLSDRTAETLRRAIEHQTSKILLRTEYRNPFWDRGTLLRIGALGLLCVFTLWFYTAADPLSALQVAAADASPPAPDRNGLDIPKEPDTQAAPAAPEPDGGPWGEIRISEPGHNLRITQNEDVPLLIEAAASRALTQVRWSTSVNNMEAQQHPLPPAEDPRYAVHQPVIHPEALGLQLWDLLRYQATATCGDGVTYTSQSYFVEVIPERPELEQLDPQALLALEQMTGLVERQQEVVLQTERLQQSQQNSAATDTETLAAITREEQSLRTATEVLDAVWSEQLGAELTAPLSETLNEAREDLQRAEAALEQTELEKSAAPELAALEHLVAARGKMARLIEDHPELFQNSPSDPLAQDAAEQSRQDNLQERLQQNIEQYSRIEAEPEDSSNREVQQATDTTLALLEDLNPVAQSRNQQPDDGQRGESPETQEKAGREQNQHEKEQQQEQQQEKDEEEREWEEQIRQQCAGLREQTGSRERQAAARSVRESLEALAQSLRDERNRRAAEQTRQQVERKLQERRERDQQLAAAREFVQETLEQERTLQAAATQAQQSQKKSSEFPQLEQQQRDLREQLEEFLQQNSQCFSNSTHECRNACAAMSQAGKMLANASGAAPRALDQAAQELQQLDNALARQQRANSLAQAPQLREALQGLHEQLSQMAEQPAQTSPSQKQQTASQSRRVADDFDRFADATSPASTSTPSPSLEQPRTAEQREALRQQSTQLEQAAGEDQTAQAAEALGKSVRQMRDALDQELPLADMSPQQQQGGQEPPSGTTPARRLLPVGHEAIERGLQQLESAVRQQQSPPRLTRQQEQSLRRSGAAQLSAGIESEYGYNERTRAVLQEMQHDVAERTTPVDAATLQRLRNAVQQLQHDLRAQADAATDPDETFRVDLSRFPPEYRDAVRAYYENLSEAP